MPSILDAIQDYVLSDEEIAQIQARTLVFDAEAEQFHVQPGATAFFTHRLFDWLDQNL
ncbi:hypothetical protein G6O69_05655 [Pseudenhygromyxa sp. WMMC2535]|uniref:hypothetical protein n=1 Tax=Pseudenhygromyxa sp. WMMC2535 TaxID=2712867 RepID=UPI0015576D1C|nr:hypothetical protein [Pseudenhygromyxa sp. WMMC2535]NVB37307.1 hypothetical protein [Pseudenhygromyxa sp. WMMC2535]